jgi:hypothetical protein
MHYGHSLEAWQWCNKWHSEAPGQHDSFMMQCLPGMQLAWARLTTTEVQQPAAFLVYEWMMSTIIVRNTGRLPAHNALTSLRLPSGMLACS